MVATSSLITNPAFSQSATDADSSNEVFVSSLTTSKSGLQTRQGQQSQSAGSEASSAIGAGSPPSTQDLRKIIGATPQDLTALSACTWWWVHGTHSWSWSGIPFVGFRVNLSARSWTTYGTSTSSCGTPMVVDRLHVAAQTYGMTAGNVALQRTAFNVSSIEGNDSIVTLLEIPPCGASSFHEAIKSGITWNIRVRSGCAP